MGYAVEYETVCRRIQRKFNYQDIAAEQRGYSGIGNGDGIKRLESEKNTDFTDLKQRWGMGETKPIDSGVEAMPRRNAFESMLSVAIGTDSFGTNQMKDDIAQTKLDKKSDNFLDNDWIPQSLGEKCD